MIIVWPLIVSKTVNPNILPGVCKALEKYIYVYRLDEIIDTANGNIRENQKKDSTFNFIKKVGSALKLESSDVDPFNYIEEAPGGKKGQTQSFSVSSTNNTNYNVSTPSPRPTQKERDPYADAIAGEKAKGDYKQLHGEAPKIDKVDSASINTEPTWNTVTDQQGRTSTIGVKVVPYVIQNEGSLIELMTLDRYRSALSRDLQIQSRKTLRVIQNIANRVWSSTIGKFLSWTGFIDKNLIAGTITQNWKNDIILQNTAFGDKMFILLNKMDLDEGFLSNAKGIKKLFSLGWTSFVIADDINKVVNFCMKDYKGLCSIVNYGFLYSDSRSQHQVYKDIDEISSRSGPLFRLKNNRKNMITDNLAQYKLDMYKPDIMLSESDLSGIIEKVKNSPENIVSNLKAMISSAKRSDMNAVYKISKKFNPGNKKIDISRNITTLIKEDSLFKQYYNLSYTVFKNSLSQLSTEDLTLGATLCAGIFSLNNDKNYNIKNDLKNIVMRTREKINTLDEDNDAFAKDMRVAFAFALITVILGSASIMAALYTLIHIAPQLAAVGIIILKWGAVLAVIYLVCQAFKNEED